MLASLVCEEIFSLMKLRLDNYFNLQKAGYMNMLSRVQVWSCSKRGWLLRLDFQQPSIPFLDPFSTQGLSLHFFSVNDFLTKKWCLLRDCRNSALCYCISNMIAVNIILLFWLLSLSLLYYILLLYFYIFLYCEWFLLRLFILSYCILTILFLTGLQQVPRQFELGCLDSAWIISVQIWIDLDQWSLFFSSCLLSTESFRR